MSVPVIIIISTHPVPISFKPLMNSYVLVIILLITHPMLCHCCCRITSHTVFISVCYHLAMTSGPCQYVINNFSWSFIRAWCIIGLSPWAFLYPSHGRQCNRWQRMVHKSCPFHRASVLSEALGINTFTYTICALLYISVVVAWP